MPRALLLLMGLTLRGRVRRATRGLRRPRNILFFLLGAAVFGLWMSTLAFSGGAPAGDSSGLRLYGPAAMVGLILMSGLTALKNPGVYFTPAEIEHLFPAPFPRRALILYRLLTECARLVPTSLFMALFAARYAGGYVAAWAGLFYFLALQTIGIKIVSLLAAGGRERLLGRVKIAATVAVVALFAVGALAYFGSGISAEALRGLLESRAFRAAILPFSVAGEMMASTTLFPGLLRWSAAGAGFLALAFWMLVRLDVDYREASIATSRRFQERLERMRRKSTVEVAAADSGRARVSLPMFPAWGGAGTILWRQAIGALRNVKGLITPLIAIMVFAWFSASNASGRGESALLPSMMMFVAIFGIAWLPYDFRNDFDHMESLRALPVAPFRMALGQIVAPTLLLSLIQWALLGAWAWQQPDKRPWIAGGAALVPLVHALLVGLENLAFLFYPIRMSRAGAFDFQHMGRNMVLMLAKLLSLLVAGGVAAGAGALVHFLSGGFLPAVFATSGVVLAGWVALVLFLAGRAFARFDLTAESGA